MTKREKRLQKIRQNPKNVSKAALDAVLKDFGFEEAHTAGSHMKYRHPSGRSIVVSSHKPHVGEYIVKQALKAIDDIIDEDESKEGENGENA